MASRKLKLDLFWPMTARRSGFKLNLLILLSNGAIIRTMKNSDSITRRNWISAVALLTCQGTSGAVDSRQPLPRFSAKTMEGERFTNDAVMGKPVLLQFWTTWCGYCRRDQETVDDLTKEFEAKGLVVLAVNVGESRKKVKQYLEKNPRACKVVLTEDTNLAAAFAARSYPLYVMVDREGKVAGNQQGSAGEMGLRRLLAKAGLESE